MSSTMLEERVADEQAGPGQANVLRLPQDMASDWPTQSQIHPLIVKEWNPTVLQCCCLYVYVCVLVCVSRHIYRHGCLSLSFSFTIIFLRVAG